MPAERPIASVSIDLDNAWSYMKMHGVDGWQDHPGYFDVAVPRLLDLLQAHNITGTVFMVGQDADIEQNVPYLARIADAGHEIGNHSYVHDTWFHTRSTQDISAEIARASDAIRRATGVVPVGFRSPGYGMSDALIAALLDASYLYDASTFPNSLGPLAQAMFSLTSRLPESERKKRKGTFGTVRNALRPLKPYVWTSPNGQQQLLEIPVTSMPMLRTPIHMTYLQALANISTKTALAYVRTALRACRLRNVEPSIILHPTDILGSDDNTNLAFFPGMNVLAARKVALLTEVLCLLQRDFSIVTMQQHAVRAQMRWESGEARTTIPLEVASSIATAVVEAVE